MKFIATVLGVLLIIFGTFLIPFPDYYNFTNQSVTVTIKKQVGEEKAKATAEESHKEATAAATEGDEPKKAEATVETKTKKAEVINVSLDPIIGAISVLVGIILVFMGRRVHP
jgi:hypothetical protein